VEYRSPKIDPSDEMYVVGWIRLARNDVKDSLVKDGDGSRNASNGEWLGTKHGKDECGHEGREKNLRDTILAGSFDEVERERYAWQNTRKL
jgi:hypothetical protein